MRQSTGMILTYLVGFFLFSRCAAFHKSVVSLPKFHAHVSCLTSATNIPDNFDTNENVTPSLPPWLPSFGTAALGGLLFGSDIGCSSSVVRIFGTGLTDFGQLDSFQLGLLASTSLFGAMAASAVLIFLGDKNIGRKLELQVASSLFLA